MTRSVSATLIFGFFGLAVLIGLGAWQAQRLGWKTALLAEMDARIAAAPVALPANPDPVRDDYLPVTVTGTLTGPDLRVLASRKTIGPGYRIVTALQTDTGRRILIDRGFLPVSADTAPTRPEAMVRFIGNLHWPDEVDGYTPEPDPAANLWFARDVPRMAAALGTDPVLVIARATSDRVPPLEPLPVDTAAIPNNHLQYAITWFSLALIWAGMTLVMVRRIRRGK
jgi:surfeit locus 1 family protein